MGVCTFLVSDEKKEWFDLGKVFFDEDGIARLKPLVGDDLRVGVAALLMGDLNDCALADALVDAPKIAAWMTAHPDWRFLSEQHEEFDDVYLAESDGDAEEYVSEFGDEECAEIYLKDGSL